MRKIININQGWKFHLMGKSSQSIDVDLPHTWNNFDGQDGGNDYYRGKGIYSISKSLNFNKNKIVYIECCGVSQSAEVEVNGNYVGKHDGGYSKFRFNITDYLQRGDNTVDICVDNSESDSIYPQTADFTFFGGIYRDVNLIAVDKVHFALDRLGGNGIRVTPRKTDDIWQIELTPYLSDAINSNVVWTIKDAVGDRIVVTGDDRTALATITNPILWDGVDNPHLYKVKAELYLNEQKVDEVHTQVGLRTFRVDANEGFFLNNRSYPLRGVSRHQDCKDCGYAIGKEEHEEDFGLIKEIGANSVRLAHYQHDDYFYQLCDKAGLVVWAEIPYITVPLSNGNDNAKQQLKELITQCYHHPSICFWGISNEITLHGVTQDTIALHNELERIAKHYDDTRLTTTAHIFTLKPQESLVGITDLSAYNHYFGWYMGDVGQYKDWFDQFRQLRPDVCIGLSEYGADAMCEYQSDKPEIGDYSESYQAYYHERVLEQIQQMPYLWCSYVWNMFDFACDSRNEAGEPGINHKGLITYDRKTKKDAFYVYKAYWDKEPFVHIAGKRYIYRNEEITHIKVYSNMTEVSLWVDGKLYETKHGLYVFDFEVPIWAKHTIRVKSKNLTDNFTLEKVDKPYAGYVCGGNVVNNWFNEDGLSLRSKVKEIASVNGGRELLDRLIADMRAKRNSNIDGEDAVDAIAMMSSHSLESMLIMGGITDEKSKTQINEYIKALK